MTTQVNENTGLPNVGNLGGPKMKGSWSLVLQIILGLIAAGAVGDYFNMWELSNKRDDNYIQKYVDCKTEINELNKELAQLSIRLTSLELAASEIPFPYWVKDENGVIIHISKAYETDILQPLGFTVFDLINTRGEIFGDDFLEMILANDRKVMEQDQLLRVKEDVPGYKAGTSYKYPIKSKYSGLRWTGGIWIPDDIEEYVRSKN